MPDELPEVVLQASGTLEGVMPSTSVAAVATILGDEGADLLVTSNGAARFALIALGLAPRKLRTGAFGEFAVEETGRAELIRWDVRPQDAA